MKTLAEIEAEIILTRLDFFDGNKAKTAKSLGMSAKGLLYRLEQYGVHIKKTGILGRPPEYVPKVRNQVREYLSKSKELPVDPPLTEAEIKQREKERFIYLNGSLEGWKE